MNKDHYLKPTDSWSIVIFSDSIAVPLVKLCAKLKIHPIVVTLLSFLPIIPTAYFFLKGDHLSLILGAICWQISLILDCVDGKLARFTGKTTKIGKILDEASETPRIFLLFSALLYSQFFEQNRTWLIIGIIILLYHYGFNLLVHHIYKIRTGFYEKNYCTPENKRLIKRVGCIFTADDKIFLMFVIFPLLGLAREGIIVANLLYSVSAIYLIIKKHYATDSFNNHPLPQ